MLLKCLSLRGSCASETDCIYLRGRFQLIRIPSCHSQKAIMICIEFNIVHKIKSQIKRIKWIAKGQP